MNYTYQKQLKGETIGVVLGAFAPLHKGHLDLIMRAKKENDGGCIVVVCGYKNDKGEPTMPLSQRYMSTRKYFKDDDKVAVYYINDTEIGIDDGTFDHWYEWLNSFYNDIFYKTGHEGKLRWYVGEPDYKVELNKYGENNVTLVDRKLNPISGTMIRENPRKYFDHIAYTYRKFFSHNILVLGTASEGKTTLVEDIGKYFNIPYSHEWAIDYIEEHNISDWEFRCQHFMAFLQGQYELNQNLIESKENRGVFIADTDSEVTRMYAEYYTRDPEFAMTDEEYKIIYDAADMYTKASKWDKIFMLTPRGEFVDDGTRYMEHGDMESRNELCKILENNLKRLGLWDKVTILNDGYYNNFLTVKNYIEKLEVK